MKTVDKTIFSPLLKLISIANNKCLVSSFRGSDLWEIGESVVQGKLTDDGEVDNANDNQSGEPCPHKKLRLDIINAIALTPTEETETALKDSKERRKLHLRS